MLQVTALIAAHPLGAAGVLTDVHCTNNIYSRNRNENSMCTLVVTLKKEKEQIFVTNISSNFHSL